MGVLPVIPALRRLEAGDNNFEPGLPKTCYKYAVTKQLCLVQEVSGHFPGILTLTLTTFLLQAQGPGGENLAVTQETTKLPTVDEASQKSTAPTSFPSTSAPRGSVQQLPALDAQEPEDSKGDSPEEAFPVQLDLTTNPQGDMMDVSFLYLGPEEKKLMVLPFPGKQQFSDVCPGPATGVSYLVLPP